MKRKALALLTAFAFLLCTGCKDKPEENPKDSNTLGAVEHTEVTEVTTETTTAVTTNKSREEKAVELKLIPDVHLESGTDFMMLSINGRSRAITAKTLHELQDECSLVVPEGGMDYSEDGDFYFYGESVAAGAEDGTAGSAIVIENIAFDRIIDNLYGRNPDGCEIVGIYLTEDIQNQFIPNLMQTVTVDGVETEIPIEDNTFHQEREEIRIGGIRIGDRRESVAEVYGDGSEMTVNGISRTVYECMQGYMLITYKTAEEIVQAVYQQPEAMADEAVMNPQNPVENEVEHETVSRVESIMVLIKPEYRHYKYLDNLGGGQNNEETSAAETTTEAAKTESEAGNIESTP